MKRNGAKSIDEFDKLYINSLINNQSSNIEELKNE